MDDDFFEFGIDSELAPKSRLTEEQVFRVLDAMEHGDLEEAERILTEAGVVNTRDPWGLSGMEYHDWHRDEGRSNDS